MSRLTLGCGQCTRRRTRTGFGAPPYCYNITRDTRRRAFTLLELIVVITVIAILAGVAAPALFRNVGDARVAAAKADLSTLATALETYAMTNGRYPLTSQGLSALVTKPSQSPLPIDWRGPYLRGALPKDPWGVDYIYRAPGTDHPESYDLLSLGRDGKKGGTGEDADIAAWEARK